jgi:hypothetical protein
MAENNQAFWLKRARREAFRFNSGWWLQSFLPWVFSLGMLGSFGTLALRSANQSVFGVALAALCFACGGMVVALCVTRRRFLSLTEALVRLDVDLRLHNRLSSAAQGIGEWPEPQPQARLALRWNWASLLKPPLIAIALVAASLLVPLPKRQSKPVGPTASPPSWDSIQARLDALQKSDVVQAEAIDSLRKSLDALRKQPADQWYRHESLEASDQLQEQVEHSASKLQEQLETALGTMQTARKIESNQLQALARPLDNMLGQAVEGMEFGALPLNEQILSQLKGIDSAKVRQLTPEQFKSLSEKMKAGIAASASSYSSGDKTREAPLVGIPAPEGGGVDRGPGAAPLMLSENKTELGTTQTESIHSEDLSRARAGDRVGLSSGEPRIDETPWTDAQSGGANSSSGSGGEAIWDQAATPAEQAALRRFFR